MSAHHARLAWFTALLPLALLMFAGCGGAAASAPTTVTIRYSHFTPEALAAQAGVPLTITIRNDDPIEHEWIVGKADVHERHRTGSEPLHDTRPTEVTVPPFSTRITTVVFDTPGDYLYACHLPGHEQYGMVGTLHVTKPA